MKHRKQAESMFDSIGGGAFQLMRAGEDALDLGLADLGGELLEMNKRLNAIQEELDRRHGFFASRYAP